MNHTTCPTFHAHSDDSTAIANAAGWLAHLDVNEVANRYDDAELGEFICELRRLFNHAQNVAAAIALGVGTNSETTWSRHNPKKAPGAAMVPAYLLEAAQHLDTARLTLEKALIGHQHARRLPPPPLGLPTPSATSPAKDRYWPPPSQ